MVEGEGGEVDFGVGEGDLALLFTFLLPSLSINFH